MSEFRGEGSEEALRTYWKRPLTYGQQHLRDSSVFVAVQMELLESWTPLEPGADAKHRQEDDQVQEK